MVNPMKKFCLLLACAVCGFISANAQRLIPKQKGIEVVGSIPLIKGEKLFTEDSFGVGVSLTRYLKRGNYAFVLAEYEQQNIPYRAYEVKLKDALLQVGYMHPILSDRGKNVFLYGGISALGGYEELNEERNSCPMGLRCSTIPISSMAVPCMALWRCSSRIGFCSLSRHKGGCSLARTCIIFVRHYRQDLGLISKHE